MRVILMRERSMRINDRRGSVVRLSKMIRSVVAIVVAAVVVADPLAVRTAELRRQRALYQKCHINLIDNMRVSPVASPIAAR